MTVSDLAKNGFASNRLSTAAWSTFVEANHRDNTDVDQTDIQKLLSFGRETNGFATIQYLGCGKVWGVAKVRFALSVVNATREPIWLRWLRDRFAVSGIANWC